MGTYIIDYNNLIAQEGAVNGSIVSLPGASVSGSALVLSGDPLTDYSLFPAYTRSLSNYMAFYRRIISPMESVNLLERQFKTAFSVDKAVGKQLDAIGAIVGADRVLPFSPTTEVSKILDDDSYRLLIRARIAYNRWDGTTEGLQNILMTTFDNFSFMLKDTQDCGYKLTVGANGTVTNLQLQMINAGLLIPHPAGVLVTYVVPETIQAATIQIHSGVYTGGNMISPIAEEE